MNFRPFLYIYGGIPTFSKRKYIYIHGGISNYYVIVYQQQKLIICLGKAE